MNECLEYIKQNGAEIKSLNDEIKLEKDKNSELQAKIHELELKLQEKENELKSIRGLANLWWDEYEEINGKYNNLEAKHDFVNHAFGALVPRLHEVMEDDYDEGGLFSEIIDEFKRSRW